MLGPKKEGRPLFDRSAVRHLCGPRRGEKLEDGSPGAREERVDMAWSIGRKQQKWKYQKRKETTPGGEAPFCVMRSLEPPLSFAIINFINRFRGPHLLRTQKQDLCFHLVFSDVSMGSLLLSMAEEPGARTQQQRTRHTRRHIASPKVQAAQSQEQVLEKMKRRGPRHASLPQWIAASHGARRKPLGYALSPSSASSLLFQSTMDSTEHHDGHTKR